MHMPSGDASALRYARILVPGCIDLPPGVVLLDLMMPEMDGFEVVAELRRHGAWRTIPIVVVTAKELTAEDRQWLNGYVERILERARIAATPCSGRCAISSPPAWHAGEER